MKFMWPIWPIVGLSADSPVRTRLPPWRPPRQVRPSFSRLSENSFSMLTWRMFTCRVERLAGRFPVADQRMHLGGIARLGQPIAERTLGEHLGELGQELQMPVGGMLGHEQHEHLRYRLAVRRVERD